uniref:Putative cell wall-associated hydrolase n=1 Tax=Ixodes ricinus TaxID=34613 RepID=A0A6B0UPB3_IXORI
MLSAVIPSRRSQPAMPLAEQLTHQRSVHPGPLVLRTDLLKYPTRAEDRDRTVSRRSKPSSRTALMGEQPNPWDQLQPQDATSRHRGAKPCRRYGLLGKISLLSPRYLLSVERHPFHNEPPDH